MLAGGETLGEHKKCQEEETNAMEADKRGSGLFQSLFRSQERFFPRVIHDAADGMMRCPRCTWEMVEGECQGCGYSYSFGDSDSYTDTENENAHVWMSSPSGDDEDDNEDNEESLDTDDSEEDDEDDLGSMGSFVVNDVGGGAASTHRSRWNSDDGSEAPDNSPSHVGSSEDSESSTSDVYSTTVDDQTVQNPSRSPSRSEYPDTSSTTNGRNNRRMRAVHILSSDDESATSSSSAIGSRNIRDMLTTRSLHDDDDSDESIAPVRRVPNRTLRRSRQRANQRQEPASRTTNSNIVTISSESEQSIARATSRRRRNPRPRLMSSDVETELTNEPHTDAAPPSETQPRSWESRSGRPPAASSALDAPSRPHHRIEGSNQRENINMPGAFPPSFTFSETGNSQTLQAGASTLEVPRGHLPNPPGPSRAPHSRSARASGNNSPQPGRNTSGTRDRSAAKAAHRADRERIKAEQQARRREQVGPSVTPAANI